MLTKLDIVAPAPPTSAIPVGSGMALEVLTVTPTIASAWLDTNVLNRAAKSSVVQQYARDMKSGHWKLTGDPIRFSREGQLLDGQHRLKACVAADAPFVSFVLYGADSSIREYIDIGKPRSVRDILVMDGHHQAAATTAAATVLWRLSRDENPGGRSTKPSPHEILDIIGKNALLVRSVELSKRARGVSKPMLSAIHYIGASVLKKGELADQFVDVFVGGVPAYDGDPAQLFRERGLRDSLVTGSNRSRHWIGLVHCWNLFSRREPLEQFRMPHSASIIGFKPDALTERPRAAPKSK